MKMVAARLFQGYRWTSCLTPKSFSTVNILPHVALNKTAFTTTMMVTKMKMTSFRFDRTLPSAYYYIKGGRDSRTVATLVPHSAFSPSCSNSPSVSSLDWTKKLGMDSLLVVQALCPKLLTNFSLKQYANELYDHVKRMSEPPKNPFIRPKRDKEEDEESEGADKDPDKKKNTWLKPLGLGLVVAYFLTTYFNSTDDKNERSLRFISWSEFVTDMLSRGEVKEIMVVPENETAIIALHPGAVVKGSVVKVPYFRMKIQGVDQFEEKLREVEAELGIPMQGRVPVTYSRPSNLASILLPIFVMGILIYFLSKGLNSISSQIGGGFGSMTKAKFTIIDPAKPSTGKLTSFKDVAGMEEAKREVLEFVGYLKDPTRFKRLGAKAPRGALLLGPPGCGKTLLAKAIAAESNVPFLSMAGSEFVEMIGGLGAARVRDLFKEARKRSPCIVYIDEIDAVGRKRSENTGGAGGASGEEEQTLNQLLVEMDGMTTTEGVIMLASTNRVDILDKALLRPGRFDRRIDIDPPTASERKDIFEVYLRNLSLALDPTAYSQKLAARTPGMSGADIANVCNEAALHAARMGQKKIDKENFEHAVERVVFGTEKKSGALQKEERRIVATHEAGHALCGWLLEHTDALMKVSIVPRTNRNLGFAQTVPTDIKLYTKEQLFDRMCMALGGRAAELVVFNRVTTSGEDDLKRVTKMAYRQVRLYGMSEKLGLLSFDVDMREGGDSQIKPYSKALATIIDAESRKLVHEAFVVTDKLIRSHSAALDALASKLLEKEVLTSADVESLIGPSPFPNKQKIELSEWERFTAQEGADADDQPRASSPPPPKDEE